MEEPLPEPAAVEPAPRRAHPVRNFLVQLVTITVGVLIALFFEGLVEWNNNRALVRQARTMIRRELADNKRELDGTIAQLAVHRKNLEQGLRLADELLKTRKSDIRQVNLTRQFAQLGSASWNTAERTGALGHMEYDEVQRFSALYSFQELFTTHQAKAIERIAAAGAVFAGGSPYEAPPNDLERLREHIQVLHGALVVEEDIGKALSAGYARELNR